MVGVASNGEHAKLVYKKSLMTTHVLEEQLRGESVLEMSDRVKISFCDMIIRQGNEPQTY